MPKETTEIKAGIEQHIPKQILPQYNTGRKLRFELSDTIGGDSNAINLSDCDIMLIVKPTNGNEELPPCAGTVIDADNGVCEVRIRSEVTANVGSYKAQLFLVGATPDDVISTFRFDLEVVESNNYSDAVEEEEDYTTLSLALARVYAAEQEVSRYGHLQSWYFGDNTLGTDLGGGLSLEVSVGNDVTPYARVGDRYWGLNEDAISVCVAVDPTSEFPYTWKFHHYLTHGEKGDKGDAGTSSHVYFLWSATENHAVTTTQPLATSKYIGIANIDGEGSPQPSDYKWSQYRGNDGVDGNDGASVTVYEASSVSAAKSYTELHLNSIAVVTA